MLVLYDDIMQGDIGTAFMMGVQIGMIHMLMQTLLANSFDICVFRLNDERALIAAERLGWRLVERVNESDNLCRMHFERKKKIDLLELLGEADHDPYGLFEGTEF